jgi:hypothetical protein
MIWYSRGYYKYFKICASESFRLIFPNVVFRHFHVWIGHMQSYGMVTAIC